MTKYTLLYKLQQYADVDVPLSCVTWKTTRLKVTGKENKTVIDGCNIKSYVDLM